MRRRRGVARAGAAAVLVTDSPGTRAAAPAAPAARHRGLRRVRSRGGRDVGHVPVLLASTIDVTQPWWPDYAFPRMLTRTHGLRAPLVLAGRGMGPGVGARILGRQLPDEAALIRAVMEAEIQYARTRRFWD